MSALYKSGTVTVTNGSNIVTGSGTSFISIAGLVPGALFTINGVNWYEVYEVNTNTQIKVRTIPAGQAYQQATESGQDYAIFQNFTSLSPTEIAARVVAIQQKWHIREEEMTDWFASTNDFEEITNINGDKITVMTPFGVNNLLGTAATKNVGTESGNVMEVGAFGVGTTSPDSVTDYNLLSKGGIYGDQSLSTDNQPAARRHAVQVIPRTEQSLIQHAYPIDSGFYNYQHFARLKNEQGFQGWVEYYHSGNTNFNEFRGGNSDIIATGWVNGPTQTLLFFHLNSNKAPSSMSIQSGSTFIIDDANGTPIGAPINLQLLATSSNRVAIVSCTIPTTSLSEGFPVRLEITSSNASIIFNF